MSHRHKTVVELYSLKAICVDYVVKVLNDLII